jgi:hypothetical protein
LLAGWQTSPRRRHDLTMTNNTRRLLLGALTIVVVLGGMLLIALGPASDRDTTNLGSDQFDSLRPAKVARDAAEGPIFFPDPLQQGRDIYIAHEGDDPTTGFIAFSAVNADTDCLLQFDRDIGDLVDTCDDSRHPADGTDQLQYPIEVRDDRLVIDLNFQERETDPESSDQEEP